MPNQITSTGLQTASYQELLASFTTAFQNIYGTDINLSSDTPDGQMINIFIQSVMDLQDLLTQIYNNFDPDYAFGSVLDQRVAINGIQRKAGTYTTTNIDVTIAANQSATLQGLDLYPTDPYTIADASGNKWYLLTTQSPVAGSTDTVFNYEFRAANAGANLTIPNTITIPVTIVIGVLTVNNPTTYLALGLNEETDASLKIRRQKSVAIGSQGYLSGLLAALNNINGITTAIVYENVTSQTDSNGVPAHSIWVIVGGNVEDSDVATAIYNKRNAGCGMRGLQSYTIDQIDGTKFVVNWDVVTQIPIYIRFDASSIDGVNPPADTIIKTDLPALLVPGVGQKVNINDITTMVREIDSNTLVTSCEVSTDGLTWVNIATPPALNEQFVLSSANIDITVI